MPRTFLIFYSNGRKFQEISQKSLTNGFKYVIINIPLFGVCFFVRFFKADIPRELLRALIKAQNNERFKREAMGIAY